MKNTLVIACLLFSINTFAQQRIINGTNAAQGEFPFHAILSDNNSYFCGGTLIAPEWILTAAHCIAEANPPLTITLNTINAIQLSGGHQIHSGIEFYVHPAYDDNTLENDIALIKLSTTSNLPLANLPIQNDNFGTAVGETNIIIGAGADENENDGILKKATVEIGESNNKEIVFLGLPGSCYGDSGSPSLKRVSSNNYTITGVASYGDQDCNQFSGYTKINKYREWIDETMGVFPVGINNNTANVPQIKIYYNAESSRIHIFKEENTAINIFDIQGKKMAAGIYNNLIDISHFSKGIYCAVTSQGEVVKFQKY
jgi:trypsin